jgi:hypothetical protein
MLRRALDQVHSDAIYIESSHSFEQFRKARRRLGNAGWHSASDGGCGLGAVVLRFMFGFARVPHCFELTPTEISWEVDGDGGAESVGGFIGKGGAAQKTNQRLSSIMAEARQPLRHRLEEGDDDSATEKRNKNGGHHRHAAFRTPLGPPPLPISSTGGGSGGGGRDGGNRKTKSSERKNEFSALADGALVLIYRFYCRVQNPGSKLARRLNSFEEVKECNSVLR